MKKNGFTLMELLVIIVILGIVGVLMVPSVSSVIDNSKRKTLKSSATNIERIITQRCNEEKMDGKEVTKNYTITDGKITGDVDIKLLPNSGEIYVTDDCKVTVSIVENDYCAIKMGNNVSINTNIYHCGQGVIDVPETERECFVFDEDTHTITGYNFDNEACPTNVSIPAKINGILVEHIANAAFVQGENKLLIVGSYVEGENDYPFENFTPYYDIYENASKDGRKIVDANVINVLNNNVKKDCYYNNGQNKDQKPLDYVITSGDIYDECRISLTSLEEEKDYTYMNKGKLTGLDLSKAYNLESIGIAAFMNNQIEKLTFESLPRLKQIGVSAFMNNIITNKVNLSGLTNLKIIPYSCFAYNNIMELTLPSKLTTIEANAFSENSIDFINLPVGLKKIGDYAFNNNLISFLKVPDTLEYLSGFTHNYISELKIPNKVKIIGEDAFYYNRVKKLNIPSNVEIIGEYAFCFNGLKRVVFNEGLKEIWHSAFATNSIETIQLPDSLMELYPGAFTINNVPQEQFFIYRIKNGVEDKTTLISYAGPHNPSTINVPSGVQVIESNALRNTLAKTINLPSTVKIIKSYGLSQVLYSYCTINIGTGITTIEPNAFYCSHEEEKRFCPYYIKIKRKKNAVSGANWGNKYAIVSWTGTR